MCKWSEIKNKLTQVEDTVCILYCYQLWHWECRAFEVPHSEAEKEYRDIDPVPRCRVIKTEISDAGKEE